jgi:hypothetical protein
MGWLEFLRHFLCRWWACYNKGVVYDALHDNQETISTEVYILTIIITASKDCFLRRSFVPGSLVPHEIDQVPL